MAKISIMDDILHEEGSYYDPLSDRIGHFLSVWGYSKQSVWYN